MVVVDLFAGPGGWDLAAHVLGMSPLGIEWDEAACRTRRFVDLWTLQADVAGVEPRQVIEEHFGRGAKLDLLIASPPCQAFSMAGSGVGRRAIAAYAAAMMKMWERGTATVDRKDLDEKCDDERAHLVLEPLRWALELRPRMIALEQVEPVLPVWEAMADVLQLAGYSTWTGVLSAEQYGVPQTRKRAILIASLERKVQGPAPTHQRYIPPRARARQEETLFDAPEPERIVLPEERHLEPWVSMAEALGWVPGVELNHNRGEGMIERHGDRTPRNTSQPAPCVTAGGKRWSGGPRWTAPSDVRFIATNDRPNATERDGDSPAPALAFGHNPPRWVVQYRRGGERLEESTPVDAPSPTVTSRADRWQIVDTGNTRGEGEVSETSDRIREDDEPAPTLTTRADQLEIRSRASESLSACGCDLEWVDAGGFCACCQAHVDDPNGLYAVQGDGTHSFPQCPSAVPARYNSRGQADKRSGERVPARKRPVTEPAPTIAGESRNDTWEMPSLKAGTGEHEAERAADEPAPTLRFGARLNTVAWTGERPATTVAGDPRVFPPGHKLNAEDEAAGRGGQQRSGNGWVEGRPSTTVTGSGTDGGGARGVRAPQREREQGAQAVRVTIEEALVLQSFPPDYPVQGTKTKQFEQVGNAIPPLLALRVLEAVL